MNFVTINLHFGNNIFYFAINANFCESFFANILKQRASLRRVFLALVVLGSQLASDVAFELEIADARVVETVALCALLGALYAALAFAVAGVVGRPGLVLSVGLGLALVGYLVAALFPLSDALEAWAWLSPWDWALGGDPLSNPTEPIRYAALAGATAVLLAVGGIAFAERDIRSA